MIDTTITNQPQQLIIFDEATLRNLIQEEVAKAIKETKNEAPTPYTRADVMEIFSIKETTLWNWQNNGTLHPFKLGGKVLFDRNEVDNLLKSKQLRKGYGL